MKKILKWMKLPFWIKYKVIQIMILSAHYRFVILYKPFKNIAHKLGKQGQKSISEPNQEQTLYLKNIIPVINRTCNHTPWKSECLVRAFIATHFLKKEKISYTVYLGVSKDQKGNMIAHAWTRCGTVAVTGGQGELHFTPTGCWGNAYV